MVINGALLEVVGLDLFKTNVKNFSKKVGNYRLAYINFLKGRTRIKPNLHDYLNGLIFKARRNVRIDTGTMQRRVDFWHGEPNTWTKPWYLIVFGIFEPEDEYDGAPANPYYKPNKIGQRGGHLYPYKSGQKKKYAYRWIPSGYLGSMAYGEVERKVRMYIRKLNKAFAEQYFTKSR